MAVGGDHSHPGPERALRWRPATAQYLKVHTSEKLTTACSFVSPSPPMSNHPPHDPDLMMHNPTIRTFRDGCCSGGANGTSVIVHCELLLFSFVLSRGWPIWRAKVL